MAKQPSQAFRVGILPSTGNVRGYIPGGIPPRKMFISESFFWKSQRLL